MLAKDERERILKLMRREVVPATGCTEPAAVALCVAKATEALGCPPASVRVELSANILKNAMGVGIPGAEGMIGLPIAVALGAICGKSDYNLEVLRDVAHADVEAGRRMIAEGRIKIGLKPGISEKLYVEVEVEAPDGKIAGATIAGGHTRFTEVRCGGEILYRRDESGAESGEDETDPELTLAKVYEFATTAPLEELTFILEARRLNKGIAEVSFTGDYGHSVGKILQSRRERSIMGDSIMSRIMSYTTAACDARMSGAPITVMSNSGSGNQGIATTLPVAIFAEEIFASEERTVRALILSHLTAIYIKQSLGRLSAHCGCVVAATGSANAICYLMGGNYEQVAATTKNMIANLTGMICDGAKPACSLKIASGVSTALLSAIIAMEGRCVGSLEGIIDESVDRSIRNLTHIGHDAMNETDVAILNIMTSKS